jgi:hypothetical protein
MVGPKVRRALLVVAALLVVLFLTIWAFTYHTSAFKGGLGIRDSGYFSYPRYHADVGRFPLWEPGEHQFTVQGLPPGPLYLQLYVEDATYDDRAELTSLSTSVGVSIVDSEGKEICAGTGRLSDAETRGVDTWVLSSSASSASFWHHGCRQFPISTSKIYTLRIKLSEVDAHSPHRTIVAVLAGGGHELP